MKLYRLKRILFALNSIIILIGMSSCIGYKLGNNKPAHLQKVNSVSIPIFKNETLEPRLQTLVTNATIKALQQTGAYRISKPAHSDATLFATIKNTSRRQLRSTRENVLKTKEIEIIIEVIFSLEDNLTGKNLDKGSIKGRSTSYLDSNFQLTKRQAIQLAANDLAKKLAARISEGF